MIFIEGESKGKTKVKYEFTYLDYLYFCDREKWKKMMNENYYISEEDDEFLCVKEESEEYVLDNEQEIKHQGKVGDKKHDKIFKDILQDKKEIAQFIGKFINYRIQEKELEIYNTNYITEKYEYKNADIVYKLKDKELYFLIEHQTKVDYSMAYRIFNYSLEIIRSVVEGKSINRLTYRYPRILPIVLYTGNQNWSSSNSFAQIQEGESQNDYDKIEVQYKLVDVNKYQIGELLKEKSMLTNAMILEKCKNNEEVMNCLSMIRKNVRDTKQLQQLRRVISYLYENEKDEIKREIIKIIEESECEENMSTIVERISKELADERKIARAEGINVGIRKGISQAILQTVQQMIKMNLEDEIIKQATGTEKAQIEKIRKEMGM